MQYQVDETGNKTHVVLTIAEWEVAMKAGRVKKSASQRAERSKTEKPSSKPTALSLIGSISKERAEEWVEYINEQRKEGR